MWQAADGPPAGPTDGTIPGLQVYRRRPVRPLTFQDLYNKSRTGKAWYVVFICTATSLVHGEMTEFYSNDSFLMALRKFMIIHGAPRRFQSYQGDQLVAASKQLAT
jgi:hypothetical protein